jgi:hypothetical protein
MPPIPPSSGATEEEGPSGQSNNTLVWWCWWINNFNIYSPKTELVWWISRKMEKGPTNGSRDELPWKRSFTHLI